MTSYARIPEPLQPLLADYSAQIEQTLPGLLNGFYIVGSIALGEFNMRFSDIDFVAVLKHNAAPAELEHLRKIHAALKRSHPRWEMAGIYLQVEDLGHFAGEVEPPPCYHDGVLHPHDYFEMNSVTWWILKNQGIAMTGPEPQALPFVVDWSLLITRMHDNLNSYWASWTQRPQKIIVLFSDWGIQWAVLGVLRQFYTFRENKITTKSKAGEYALTCVPATWHGLIQTALDIRDGRQTPRTKLSYGLRIARTLEAIRFLKYIIRTCNADLA